MFKLNAKFSEPYQIKTKYGEEYQRDWKIPANIRSQFFDYWRKNSFDLKDKGFGVMKKDDGEWYVTERKLALFHFKEYSHLSPKQDEQNDFILLPVYVANTDGLRNWQIESVGKLVASINKWGSAIDGSDMGIGKTYVACGVARELNMKIAVVCPKAVITSWNRVICNHFKMKKDLVGIINYESLRRGKEDSNIASFVKDKKKRTKEFVWKLPKDTLIVWDESQKLKGATTQNSKTCIAALKQGYKMLFCSATNATNPLELKTVGQAIKLFDNNKQYYQWLYAHGVEKGRFGLQFNNNKDVLKKLNRDIFQYRGVRLSRDTIPNFPDSQIIAECYNMEEESKKEINKIYDEMQKELAAIDKKILKESKSANRLTAILRARQRCEFVKVPLFIEMIEEGLEDGMSVVVFVNFTQTIEALAERLNTKCIVNGEAKYEKFRQQNIDDFQDDKERVIIVNLAAGGAGLSLGDVTGKYPRLALISPSYSAVAMRQCTGRVWRESSKTKSIQKIVFVEGTVEEEVCERVKQKLENLDLLNDGDLNIRKVNYF
jgi:superfamily II DNA or RNA helicase